MTIEFDVDGTVLLVAVTGTFDAGESVSGFGRALAYCRAKSLTGLLVDYRSLEGQASATQEILYASRIVDLYQTYRASGGHPLRLAYVGNDTFIRGWIPGQEIAQAEGIETLVTKDLEQGRDWLKGDGA